MGTSVDTTVDGMANLARLINHTNIAQGQITSYTEDSFTVEYIESLGSTSPNTKLWVQAKAPLVGAFETRYDRIDLSHPTLGLEPSEYIRGIETQANIQSTICDMYGVCYSEVDFTWSGDFAQDHSVTLTISPKNGNKNVLYMPGTELVITVTKDEPTPS